MGNYPFPLHLFLYPQNNKCARLQQHMSAFVGRDDQREEQVLLRVKDESLAKQLRQLLAGNEAKAKSVKIDLQFVGACLG